MVNMQRILENGKDARVEYPVPGSQCGWKQNPTTSAVSKHYWTRIQLGSQVVTLLGVHLIAIPTDPSRCAQREAQATILQEFMTTEIAAGNEVLLMGDFNDYDGVVLDIDSNKPTSRVLSFVKLPGLITSASEVPDQDIRYSDWYDENNNCKMEIPQEVSTIDHILATSGLELASATYIHTYNKTCNPNDWESDHWPVVAIYNV